MKEEALKLADWLEDGEVEKYDIDEASAMIRRLVEELDKYQNYWKDCEEERTERCSDCQKKGEPVAWIDYLEDSNLYDLNVSGRGIPLYTAPQTKPLSDEEIIRCMVNPDVYSENEKIAGIRFARAIEERHGIK